MVCLRWLKVLCYLCSFAGNGWWLLNYRVSAYFVFAKLSQAKPQLQLSLLALASLNFT